MNPGETAAALLAAFENELARQSILIPGRVYVAPGSAIAEDGEQLVMVLQAIGQGQPGKPQSATFVPGSEILFASWEIQLLRAIPALFDGPTIQTMIPSEEQLGESGLRLVEDAYALVNAAMGIHASQLVTRGGLQGFEVGPATPIGPEGGMAGTRMLLAFSLGGGVE